MARLPVPQDDEIKRRLRQDQQDPLIMYFVVRKETKSTFAELGQQAALACRKCLAEFGDDPNHQENFHAWFEGSFRKVCLRAKENEWQRLGEIPHTEVSDVKCFAPRHVSQRENILKKLQVLQQIKNDAEIHEFESPQGAITLIVNTSLNMSAGKMIAQIGHGAMMVKGNENASVSVCGSSQDQWEEIIQSHDVRVVRDGGLTEIAPGSETVIVMSNLLGTFS